MRQKSKGRQLLELLRSRAVIWSAVVLIAQVIILTLAW